MNEDHTGHHSGHYAAAPVSDEAATTYETEKGAADTADLPKSDEAAAPAPVPAPKAERVSSSIDTFAGTVTINGTEIYSVGLLPGNVAAALVLVGLRNVLITSDDRAKAYGEMAEGKAPGRSPAKPKEMDPWRRAVAHAVAEERARAGGIKVKSPEFADVLDLAMSEAAAMTTEKLREAKKVASVVVHHSRITGAAQATASSLLG